MKYIQSFYQYPVTFSSIGKTIPARNAQGEMKNIVEVSEKELERLQNCEPMFRELVNNKKIRILNKIPASYVPPAQQINKAQDEAASAKAEAEKLRKENEEMRAKLAALEAGKNTEGLEGSEDRDAVAGVEVTSYEATDYKALQEMAKEHGINPNQKKTALIEELKKYDAEHASK